MPLYEYRCAECYATFEQRRSMSDSDADVRCPDGHADVRKLLSVFATAGRGATGGAPAPAPMPTGGGCGSCACH